MSADPFQRFVDALAQQLEAARELSPPSHEPLHPHVNPQAGVAMLVSPHPDDECITGALALRLRREAGMRVVNVPLTLGSNPARREARLAELRDAAAWMGFELALEPGLWSHDERWVTSWLQEQLVATRPKLVVFPHDQDLHHTHQQAHRVAMSALELCGDRLECLIALTEYWQPMAEPNLVVESSSRDVAHIVAGISLHRGEVARNPYHVRLPSWMVDNARRAERVLGKGSRPPAFHFATLYRLVRFAGQRANDFRDAPLAVPASESIRASLWPGAGA